MSPIGRIFIVLNLALAGGFVFVAGTVLQKSTEYVTKHDELQVKYNEDIETRDAQISKLNSDFTLKDRQLATSESAKSRLETENDDLRNENQRLSAQLNSMASTLETVNSELQTIASALDRNTQDAAEARQTSIAAGKERDEAVRAMEVAVADLRDAEDRIAGMDAAFGESQMTVAKLSDKIAEQQIILDVIRQEYGDAVFLSAVPALDGTVRHVGPDGKLVTVAVTANPSSAEIRPGYRFAIYSGETYKGEARITEVDGDFAFCLVDMSTGPRIEVGDRASTRTN